MTRSFIALISIPVASCLVGQDSLNMKALFHWHDPSIPIGTEEYQDPYNEVWGYAAEGREYAFLGSSLGIHVFDVTEPAGSVLIGMVPGKASGTGIVHRDMKTYAGHLYAVCDEGASSLQIVDLQYLPDSVHVVYDSDELLVRAHNIQIDTLHARLYTCGGSSQFSVFSLDDPAEPVLLNDLEADVPWWPNAVGYVHDCHVRDNIVWCNDEDGMHVVDFTDPFEPVLLGSLVDYPQAGYNHSGWLNGDGSVYVMADENHGSPLKFIPTDDLSDLEVISTLSTDVHPFSIPHNPFYVDDLLHVAYYYDGYWLWNTSDPLDPVLLGYYDTSIIPHADSYYGSWGVYPYLPSGHVLVSDMQTGLWVLDIEQALHITAEASTPAFRIFPTLTTGSITIMPLFTGGGVLHYDIHSTTGAGVLHGTLGTGRTVDLSALRDGMFLVRVSDGTRTHVQRIFKTGS